MSENYPHLHRLTEPVASSDRVDLSERASDVIGLVADPIGVPSMNIVTNQAAGEDIDA